MFEGAMPALITPFTKDDRIDGEGLRKNIEFVEAEVKDGGEGEAEAEAEIEGEVDAEGEDENEDEGEANCLFDLE